MSYIAVLGIVSFAISMTLLGLSLFEIKKLCILCAFTYILNLFIGLIAIKGMLPKNSLGRKLLTNVRVFKGEEHDHQAQKPEIWNF